MMRHAKAEPYADDDRSRTLTARGRTDAAAAGAQLAAWGIVPDHVVVSAAARTLETWSLVREQLDGEPVEEVSEAIYAASSETVLEALRLVPDDHRTVLLIGHNPCVAYLATVLHDGNGDPDALRRLLTGFPPAAAAVLELDGGWASLGEGTTRLTHVHTP